MNLSMPQCIKLHYQEEINNYRKYFSSKEFSKAWVSLERSHILGQRYPLEHTYTHWLMLIYGFKIKNFKEVIGQLPRLIAGGIKSFVGVIPVGNTGGSNVSALRAMPIPLDLKIILENKHTENG